MRAVPLLLLVTACGASPPQHNGTPTTDEDTTPPAKVPDLLQLFPNHTPIGYYHFDNDVRDSGPNANDLDQSTGTVTFASDGALGEAIAIYDSSLILNNRPSEEVSYFSFSLWFRSDLIHTANSNSGQTFFKFSCATCGGNVDVDIAYYAAVRDDGTVFEGDKDVGVVTANTWHHLAGTYAAGYQVAVLDGVLVRDDSGTYDPMKTSGGYLWLGELWPNAPPLFNPQYLHGGLDEVAFWSDMLTPDELTQIYTNQTP